MYQQNFPPEIAQVTLLLNWLEEISSLLEISPKVMRQIELALEEAFVNIIEHGKPPKGSRIQVELFKKNETIQIVLKDQGTFFDSSLKPKKLPSPNSLSNHPLGGVGLHLLHRMMDEIEYEREAEYNILKLTKKIRPLA